MAGESVVVTHLGGYLAPAQVVVVGMRGLSGGVGQVVVTGIRGVVPGAFTVTPGSAQTVDPFQVVQLNATWASDVTVDSVTWSQTGGTPVVTLFGASGSVQYQAPATMLGTALTFTVVVVAGAATVSASVVHTVRSHTGMWRLSLDRTHLIPVEYRRTAPASLGTAAVQPPGALPTLPTRATSPILTTQG